ncbi:beta strand repeat-containing protein [Variovorax sp. DAIF25]|uniref:beta strand repeat-containing protein n=1 Tax=Variovorax sp. DAIF25 TaxID=3080983 RepID=UPI003D6AB1AA
MKARKIRNRGARRPATSLSRIGSAVAVALLAAGAAQAADTTVSNTLNGSVSGASTANSQPSNTNGVTAGITGAVGGTTVSGTPANPNPIAASTTGNLIGASAAGNDFANAIQPASGSPASTPVDNAASLGVATNSGSIAAGVANSRLAVELNNFTSGSAAATDNTISASTVINKGSSLVTGGAMAGAVGITGGAALTYPGGTPLFDAQGNIVVTSLQLGTGPASGAGLANNRIDLALTSTLPGNIVVAGATLDRNTLSATLRGNSASSAAEIQSGAAPSFAGSAVVSNLQANGNGILAAVTHAADNTNSTVQALVTGAPAGQVNELRGSLSVQGNTISSAATGNEALSATAGSAGNRIVMNGVSVVAATPPLTPVNASVHGGTAVTTTLDADLAVLNSQGNLRSSVLAQTINGQVLAGVQSIDGGSVTLKDNSVSAAATGNIASSAILPGTTAASFTATAGISNQQANTESTVSAVANGTVIAVQTGDATGQTNASTVTVANNSAAVAARGNQINQGLALDANTVALGSDAVALGGGTSADGRVSATGAVTLTNLQGNYNGSLVTAINGGSKVWLVANGPATVADSALSLTGNRQEAVAVGSGATSDLSIKGNAVGTGAGIASVQMNDATSSVGAVLSVPEARVAVFGNLSGGSAAVSDNLQRAIAYGNSATSTLGVQAGNVTVNPSTDVASTITANLGNNLPFDNSLATQPAVNASYAILGSQSIQSTVGTTASGVNSFAASVSGDVASASLGNDRNAFVAASYGNDAANGLKLAANQIASSDFASVANVTNVQSVAGANTKVEANTVGGNVVRTVVGGGLQDASVSSSGNTTQALAYGSRATGNTVDVTATSIDTAGLVLSGATVTGGVATTDASFSVQNAQSGQGTVAATRSGGPEVLTQIAFGVGNSKIDADNNTTAAAATSNSAVNGVRLGAAGIATTTAVQNLQVTTAKTTSELGLEGGALTDQAGVQLAVSGKGIVDSQLSVDGNAVRGAATGNTAVNGIDVKGNTIDTGGVLPVAAAANAAVLTGALGDHALSNAQLMLSTATISSKAAGAFGIDTAPGTGVNGSTLSVSNNAQSAKAVANSASNDIALAAGSVSATSALQSGQASLAAVEARSFVQAFAPASVSSASVTISGNANSALAVVNDATSRIAVAADTTASAILPTLVLQAAGPGDGGTAAIHALMNRQSAATSASATADSAIYNDDRAVPGGPGVVDSAVAMSGNQTLAEAAGNRAGNAVSLTGGASQGATTGLLNSQASSAAVGGVANNTTRLTLNGTTALIDSSATLEGNTTGAAATGNASTNSIEVKGGAIATGLAGSAGTAAAGSAVLASADHALVNVQVGAGPVGAIATGSIGIDTTGTAAVQGATLSVSDNRQSARAASNTTVNGMTLSGANVDARAVVQSTQVGQAAVAASSNSELFAPAASSGSSVRISGNTNTALGVMNDATNTLDVKAANLQPAATTGAVTLSETAAGGQAATGDHLVANRQAASTSVTSSASTAIYNDDRLVPNTAGLFNGAVTISNNSTLAEASANRAINTATVAGDATQGASVGVSNAQTSSAVVTSSAVTAAGVTIAGTDPLNAGSVALNGNTTSALARGNAATNLVDSSAGGSYGGAAPSGSVGFVASPLALNLGASVGVLNSQTNSGPVNASSTNTSYQVALNATGPGTLNGSVGVYGNTLSAQAFGNSATNRVTQTALNTGTASAAVGNYQVNSGAVSATVTTVNFGVGVVGPVGSSTLRTTGNQVTASATGNSATSSILSR